MDLYRALYQLHHYSGVAYPLRDAPGGYASARRSFIRGPQVGWTNSIGPERPQGNCGPAQGLSSKV